MLFGQQANWRVVATANIVLMAAYTAEEATIPTNLLLEMIPAESRAILLTARETVELPQGFVLWEAGQSPVHAHFLISGLAKLVNTMADGSCVNSGLVGREGVPEAIAVLGHSTMLPRCSILVPATVIRIAFSQFQLSFATDLFFRQALLRFVQFETLVIRQIAACNSLHETEQRLARWILMIDDRVSDSELPITQECTAQMLGTRRTTISKAARGFLDRGLIQYRRGKIAIVDRIGLEQRASECYGITVGLFQELALNSLS